MNEDNGSEGRHVSMSVIVFISHENVYLHRRWIASQIEQRSTQLSVMTYVHPLRKTGLLPPPSPQPSQTSQSTACKLPDVL